MSIPFQDLLGAPFLYGGRDLETGIDCLGLLGELYRRRGTPIEIPGSGQEGDVDRQIKILESVWQSFEEIQYPGEPGDVVLMVGHDRRQHVTVRVEGDLFLHASIEEGVRTIRWDEAKRSMSKAYRYVDHRS